MTVNTISSIAEFDTNGVTTNYPFYFKFMANEDLVVTYVDPLGVSSTLTLGTGYTVNGAGNDDGGSVVTTTALAGPGQLVVSREMAAFQQTSLRNQGKFLAETHEDVFDKLTMLIQQGFAVMRRALLKPIGKNYYDAQGLRIVNLGAPEQPLDATTKKWVSDYFGSLIDQATGQINTTTGILYDSGTLFDYLKTGLPRLVDSVSALRELSSARNQRAATLGYYIRGDGGSGLYYLDPTDTTSADNGGTVVVSADGGRWKLSDNKINVKQFGARGDGSTDDTLAWQTAHAHAATLVVGRTVTVPSGTYRTSATVVVPDGCSSEWAPGVVLQRHGSASKTFAAIQLNGNGRRHELGIIDNYKDGILVRGSTNTVVFQTVSNCTRGVIISAVDRSSLDNKISGTQIGLCTEAIVFEQNGIRTQQGNEVRVNFVSETLHTLVFDDLGTHTETSDWDSNFVELMASDPFYKAGATLAYNKSAFGVPNLHYIIKSWAGGWNYNDGTITVIQGGFATCQFEFSFAAQLSPQSMLGPTLRTGYGGCQVKLLRNQNLGTNTAFTAVISGSIDTFNGGIALSVKRFRIACTVPALAVGQSAVRVFSHVLCQSSYGGKFKIASVEANSHPYIINIRELGTTTVGMVGIGFQNPSAATIPETTLNLIIEAGD